MIGTTNMDLTGGGISRLYVWEKYTRKKEIVRDNDHVVKITNVTEYVDYYRKCTIASTGEIITQQRFYGSASRYPNVINNDYVFYNDSTICWGGFQDSNSDYYAYLPYVTLSENPDTLVGYVTSLKRTDYPEDGCSGNFYYKLITSDKDIGISYLPKLIPVDMSISGTINNYSSATITRKQSVTLNTEQTLETATKNGFVVGANILIVYNNHLFFMNITEVSTGNSGANITGNIEMISYATNDFNTTLDPDDAVYYLIL